MSDYDIAIEQLNVLFGECSSEQVQATKDLFWKTADAIEGGKAEMQRTQPVWCAAIDALPQTDQLRNVNVVCLEMTVDIVKRALGEVAAKRRAAEVRHDGGPGLSEFDGSDLDDDAIG